MSHLNVTIRPQDQPVWERAREVAEAEYLPFSRFLTKLLARYLDNLDRQPQETS